jgi:hypothetical protein
MPASSATGTGVLVASAGPAAAAAAASGLELVGEVGRGTAGGRGCGKMDVGLKLSCGLRADAVVSPVARMGPPS